MLDNWPSLKTGSRISNIQHAVLVLRALDDEEEAEVARLPGAHHSLAHLLFPLVENAATI